MAPDSRTVYGLRMLRRLIAFTFLLTACTGPVFAQDAAEIVLRLNRLENQVRQMAGQIDV